MHQGGNVQEKQRADWEEESLPRAIEISPVATGAVACRVSAPAAALLLGASLVVSMSGSVIIQTEWGISRIADGVRDWGADMTLTPPPLCCAALQTAEIRFGILRFLARLSPAHISAPFFLQLRLCELYCRVIAIPANIGVCYRIPVLATMYFSLISLLSGATRPANKRECVCHFSGIIFQFCEAPARGALESDGFPLFLLVGSFVRFWKQDGLGARFSFALLRSAPCG
jgi:hypothetical protein